MAILDDIDGRVVVGVDTSDAALSALDWALDWARHAKAGVTLVHVVPRELRFAPGGGADPAVTAAHSPVAVDAPVVDSRTVDAARAAIEAHVADRLAAASDVESSLQVVQGAPPEVLVDASERAALVVVGTRGLGAIKSTVLGSVSGQTLTYALGPVAVVGAGDPLPSAGHVTVGVDLSPESLASLDYAVDAAARLGAAVHVIHVVDHGVPVDVSGIATLPPSAEIVEAASAELDKVVASYRESHPGVEITTSAKGGHPVAVLAADEGSSVLVVGNRGRGAWARLLLGSTSHRLAHHAPVATLVVRRPRGA